MKTETQRWLVSEILIPLACALLFYCAVYTVAHLLAPKHVCPVPSYQNKRG